MHQPSPELEREQAPQGTAHSTPEVTDYAKKDARAEALEGDAGEQSPELREAINEVSEKATELTDTIMALRPDTDVQNTEINGEFAEVTSTDFGDGARVERMTNAEGESTVIHLSLDAADSSTGATTETVTIKHTNPVEIMIGDQLATNIDDVNSVRRVIAQLRQEVSGLPGEEEVKNQEAAEQIEEDLENGEIPEAENLDQLSPKDRQKHYEQALQSEQSVAA